VTNEKKYCISAATTSKSEKSEGTTFLNKNIAMIVLRFSFKAATCSVYTPWGEYSDICSATKETPFSRNKLP